MRLGRCCVIVLLLAIGGACLADSIYRKTTVHSRDDWIWANDDELLTVHFIDVGGGDAILIDTPSDKKILVDGGWNHKQPDQSLTRPEYGAYIDEFLGDDVVDLIIISHPDYDHIAGLGKIVEEHDVVAVWYTGYDSHKLSGTWKTLLSDLQPKPGLDLKSPAEDLVGIGIPVCIDDSGTPGQSDDVVLTILNAPSEVASQAYGSGRYLKESKRRNSSSLVFRMDYGETSFLFTGDTNGRKKWSSDVNKCDDEERRMVDSHETPGGALFGKLNCTVLKVAHHGSDGSSSLPFLAAVSPEWAVISAGVPHGHPHAPVLERLKHTSVGLSADQILRTDYYEGTHTKATEANLGDDCYQFVVDPEGVVSIERWKICLSPD